MDKSVPNQKITSSLKPRRIFLAKKVPYYTSSFFQLSFPSSISDAPHIFFSGVKDTRVTCLPFISNEYLFVAPSYIALLLYRHNLPCNK
jgi:hypothetical protein